MKGGQAQGPLVKSLHIPLLSEGIEANPGLLRQNGGLITEKFTKKSLFKYSHYQETYDHGIIVCAILVTVPYSLLSRHIPV